MSEVVKFRILLPKQVTLNKIVISNYDFLSFYARIDWDFKFAIVVYKGFL